MLEKAEKKLWNGGSIECFVMLNLEDLDEERNTNIGFYENGGLSCLGDAAFLQVEQPLDCCCRERERAPRAL